MNNINNSFNLIKKKTEKIILDENTTKSEHFYVLKQTDCKEKLTTIDGRPCFNRSTSLRPVNRKYEKRPKLWTNGY